MKGDEVVERHERFSDILLLGRTWIQKTHFREIVIADTAPVTDSVGHSFEPLDEAPGAENVFPEQIIVAFLVDEIKHRISRRRDSFNI